MEPFYGHQPSDGLHVLKDAWRQKAYLGPQSKLLAEQLKSAIEVTFVAAHIRTQGFQLDRSPTEGITDRSQERSLEAAMLQRWNRPEMWPIPGGWERLVAFQVPLFAQQQMEQWGYVDLLGVNSAAVPVVVELKKAPKAKADGRTGECETPLRMVMEAAAYAVSLRKNWPRFRPEWIARLTQLEVSGQVVSRVPETLDLVPLVAVAPSSFWLEWLPVSERGKTVTAETWQSFRSLLSALEAERLSSTNRLKAKECP